MDAGGPHASAVPAAAAAAAASCAPAGCSWPSLDERLAEESGLVAAGLLPAVSAALLGWLRVGDAARPSQERAVNLLVLFGRHADEGALSRTAT